jgi:prophage regulatory protein
MNRVDDLDDVERQEAPPPPPSLRILRMPQVMEQTGLSRPQIYRLETSGRFPRRVPLGTRHATGWLEHEVQAWIAERIAARPPPKAD